MKKPERFFKIIICGKDKEEILLVTQTLIDKSKDLKLILGDRVLNIINKIGKGFINKENKVLVDIDKLEDLK